MSSPAAAAAPPTTPPRRSALRSRSSDDGRFPSSPTTTAGDTSTTMSSGGDSSRSPSDGRHRSNSNSEGGGSSSGSSRRGVRWAPHRRTMMKRCDGRTPAAAKSCTTTHRTVERQRSPRGIFFLHRQRTPPKAAGGGGGAILRSLASASSEDVVTTARTSADSTSGGMTTSGPAAVPPRGRLKRAVCCFFTLGLYGSCGADRDRRALNNMRTVADSRFWLWLTYFGSFVTLFGQPIQFMFCPASWDIGFAVLFTATAVVLFTDIIFHCCLEPTYFLWHCRLCGSHKRNTCCYRNSLAIPAAGGGARSSVPPGVEISEYAACCRLGSFMFWLDLISTCSLLPEIQFINPGFFEVEQVPVDLMDGFMNEYYPFKSFFYGDLQILLVIARSTRLARFVSASNVVLMSEWLTTFSLVRLFTCAWTTRPNDERGLSRSSRRRRGDVGGAGWWGRFWDGLLGFFGGRRRSRSDRREAETKEEEAAAIRIQRRWRRRGSTTPTSGDGSSGEGSGVPPRRERPVRSSAGSTASGKKPGGGGGGGSKKQRSSSTESSQVGGAMRELTAQRMAGGILIALVVTMIFSYSERDITPAQTMAILHEQTQTDAFSTRALGAARDSSAGNLYEYRFANGTAVGFALDYVDTSSLRDLEKLNVTVQGVDGVTSGLFERKAAVQYFFVMETVATVFIMLMWIVGVVCFTGPVRTLVVIPIERMTRLLSLLTKDPLGYQETPKFKKIMEEEHEIVRKTQWTEDVLKGMETSFLMSTMLQIGSLMRVGFGSAGVEIIRNNLQKGSSSLAMNLTGSIVSCIFLFCDIRQFTDATEALQEEVFVFTNRIAAVVHSICSSYGGSANKNVGDAFLLSWRLDDVGTDILESTRSFDDARGGFGNGTNGLSKQLLSRSNQADRALLSVIKICIALYNDSYFLEKMSNFAKEKLMEKIAKRKGPCVQMGCGLHAGKAVQGAIGSQRKIDPTYVGETVDRSETLESLTKRYGLKMLMSDAFHNLLSLSNQRRCRKIDQLILNSDDEVADEVNMLESGEIMELFTFDMDIDALRKRESILHDSIRNVDIDSSRSRKSKRGSILLPSDLGSNLGRGKRATKRTPILGGSQNLGGANMSKESLAANVTSASGTDLQKEKKEFEFCLPSGPAKYSESVWLNEEMRVMRKRYIHDGLFYPNFNSGLHSYFDRDWVAAKECFSLILERFEDGPSRYFLNVIEEHDCRPPHDFTGYGTV